MSPAKLLIAANVLVWVANVATGLDPLFPSAPALFDWGASFGPANVDQPWRLLAACFLHGGLIHLAVNMQALWIVGPIVERLFGRTAFVVTYLAAGVFGMLAASWTSEGVTVGASGAIFGAMGVIGAAVLRLGRLMAPNLLDGLKSLLWSFVAINLVIGLLLPNVSNAAHLGGLAAGFVLGLVLAGPEPHRGPGALRVATAALLAAGGAWLLWRLLALSATVP